VTQRHAASAGEPYPGSRLGVPADGPGSVASWGRRFLALAVDWVASLLVAGAFFGTAVWGQGWQAWAPMGVFLVEASVLTALVGGSFGQLVLRVAVVRVDNKPLNLLQTVARTALICLVVPPLVFNRDNRGLHDLAVGTVTLRR
jgi:RDD family